MADRTTKVTLVAQVAGYVAGMDQAARSTKSLTGNLSQQKANFDLVGRSLIAIGAVAAAGVGLAIKSFADFDAKMAQVKTLAHATADEMTALADAALHMGQSIGFSAVQVADAEVELVKAGVSVADIMGGALQGALVLAAAGQIDVADATEIATIALTQFGLKGKDVPHVADLLAAGADKALGGVSELGEALKSGGLVAAQFGVTLDETVGTLAAFANAGLLGETAGTGLRQMLLKLSNPSTDAAKTLKDLGISIYDTSGQFVGISGLAGQLHDKMADLTPAVRNAALATIFGSRAIQGANVLYKEGAEGISKWTNEVNDTGFAAHQAAGKMDNLKGDLSKLGAAFNTNLIESGSQANEVMRTMVQTLTNVTKAFGGLPSGVQGSILAIGALVAIVGLVGGTALVAVPKVAAFKTALTDLKIGMKGVSLAGGAVALAITALVTILGAVAQAQADATARTEEYGTTLDETTGKITKSTREVAKANLATKDSFLGFTSDSAFDAAKKLGIGLDLVTDAALGNVDAMRQVDERLDLGAVGTKKFEAALKKSGLGLVDFTSAQEAVKKGITGNSESLKDAIRIQEQKTSADKNATDTQLTAADAYKKAANEAKGLDDQLTSLIDTINKANGVGQDAVTTNNAYQDALAGAADQVKKAKAGVDGYALGIDSSTAAGRKNTDMLVDLAKKGQAAAKAQFDLDGNTNNYVDTLKASHQAVYDSAVALGATVDQAELLADKIAGIPSAKEVKILVDTKTAQDQLNDFVSRNSSLSLNTALHLNPKAFGSGGYTGDIPRTVAAGVVHGREFVNDADSTAKPSNRAAMEFMNAGGDIRNYSNKPAYTPAPAYSGGGMGGGVSVDLNLREVTDSQAVAEIVMQGLRARLVGV